MHNPLYFAQPILVSLTTFNRLRTPVERRPMCLLKRKRKEKEKKKKRKRKSNRRKLQRFALKPEHGPRGLWRKPLKSGALSQLVGSHRLSVHNTGGWVKFSEL